jgi:hypothetical protein
MKFRKYVTSALRENEHTTCDLALIYGIKMHFWSLHITR